MLNNGSQTQKSGVHVSNYVKFVNRTNLWMVLEY